MKNKKIVLTLGGIALGTFLIAKLLFKNAKKMIVEKTWDSKTDAIISKLHPELRPIASNFINEVEKKLGHRLRITDGHRTFAQQNELYAQGRTKPGKIVTNAKGGQSYHNFALAFDCYFTENGKVTFKKGISKEVAQIGKNLGLEWGGDWKTLKDLPHFQLNKGTIAQLNALYNSGKKDNEGYLLV